MLRLILVGSLLAIGFVGSNIPDQPWLQGEKANNRGQEEEHGRFVPNNREAEEEVKNLIDRLQETGEVNETDWAEQGFSPRPKVTFVQPDPDDQTYAKFGPKNSLLTPRNGSDFEDEENYTDFANNFLGIQENHGGKHTAQDLHNLKVFGEFGKNYFTEFGKPYINCAVSDYERPLLQAMNSTNSRTKKCFIEWGRSFERLACMAVFMYKGTAEELKNDPNPRANMVIQNQNCWTNQDAAIETCTKASKCMFNGMIEAGKQHFCCCNEHNCNDMIDFDPNGGEEDAKVLQEKEKKDKERKTKEIIAAAEAEHQRNVLILIAVFACIAICALAVITFFVCRWKIQKRRAARAAAAPQEEPLIPGEEPREKVWQVINSSLEEIGQGKYGRVYKAQFRERPDAPLMTVAVKTFKSVSGSSSSYANELAIYNEPCMKKCQKNSILRLLEFDLQEKVLVTEYYEMGNLHYYLEHQTISQPLDCLSLIVSLLEALTFLHEERGPSSNDPKPVILHRDVKSHNVLLKTDSRNRLVGVLMDFGLSMKCSQVTQDTPAVANQMHKVVGTQRYMAPELLVGSAELDIPHFKAIDVYAMALVLWEVTSRTTVFPGDEVPDYAEPLEKELRREQPHDALRLSTYRQVVAMKRTRPAFRQEIKNDRLLGKVIASIEEMWEHDAGCRVSAACVQKRMEVVFDEGYHSGTIDEPESLRSLESESSVTEKTSPSGRSSTHSDNNTVIYETDETAPSTSTQDVTNEAARLLGGNPREKSLPNEHDAIEMEMR